ncbi:hypothetical protein C8J56DRAFT_1048295 [Mycena floridula]|nr:hypothetical protein C8J56DRAFT_1048295 [Mycena floridula]
MKHPGWPFSLDDEQDILSSIIDIEASLSSAQPQPTSLPISATNITPAVPHHARLSAYGRGSSMHINADQIHAGTVGGSILSNNTIQMNADPAVYQKVDNLLE